MNDKSTSTRNVAPLGLGVSDAARAAGVGRTAVYEALKSGALVARKLGRRTIILIDDLNAWLASLPRM
ncbi:helix-turn-helix domain-containing protein [Salinarimonas ramus]|nr:helix-turn-helix domain-containing protein [Salinarimonas ramus]